MTLMGNDAFDRAAGACPPEFPRRALRDRDLAAMLAALGPVLLLARSDAAAHDIDACAARLAQTCAHGAVVPRVNLDPCVGSHEELALLDAHGVVQLRLVRLPESDWLGWDRAVACADAWVESTCGASGLRELAPTATILRAARRLPVWRARPVRLRLSGNAARPLVLQPLAHCSWPAWRVIDALRAGSTVELAASA